VTDVQTLIVVLRMDGGAPEAARRAEASPIASRPRSDGLTRGGEAGATSGCVEERALDDDDEGRRDALKERGGGTGWHASLRLDGSGSRRSRREWCWRNCPGLVGDFFFGDVLQVM
jgi:hypothetical protein